MKVDFIPNEDEQELALEKCEEVLNLLQSLSTEMKGYILMVLIGSFKSTYGIDLYKSMLLEKEETYREAGA